MEQKDYKKLLRKIQLSANMFIDRNSFAGWVYSIIATELDENAHWNFMSTDLLTEFNKEIDNELRRRRGELIEDKKKQEPAQQLPIKTRKSLKGATIYSPSKEVMKKVNPKVKRAMYEPDDGPLTDKEVKAVRKAGKKQIRKLGLGKTKVRSSLFPKKVKKTKGKK